MLDIDSQCFPLATNNLPIEYQCTIILSTKFVEIGKNKYFIFNWQNIGKTLALGTIH